ncbi:MAG: CoB--CoM heterodisulfide reductase iron-sulfur subunit A family protein, partial [Lentisphaerae bacterium]|nr:CoB--CoM heterodisulfide reductase iron-sulfur subunit A family protein [Lentisphaerota bacterium]
APQTCIGCAECIPVCPVSAKNPVNNGLNEKKAIDFFFFGGLPNAPFIDPKTCLRFKGESCDICLKACPMEGAVVYGDREEILERNVGAIIVAIGSELYDCSRLPELGYGRFPDVYTSLEFERLLAANGPTTGALVTRAGAAPKSVAIVHCAGSLDERHKKYCSAVCCMSAFKFNHLIGKKAPEAGITHFFKTVVAAGKEEAEVYHHALHNPKSRFVQYREAKELTVSRKPDGAKEIVCSAGGREERGDYDMVVLCPAMVPRAGAAALGKVLEIGSDKTGFFEELNGRIDATKSRVKGIYLAGTCQAPMDIQKAVSQGAAASGSVLSSLVEGRKLEIEPVTAEVDEDRCSACKSCMSVCPYKAIAFDAEKEVAHVNPVLCVGCGTCVAACPSGAIKGKHFTQDQIFAEIEGVLA